MRIKEKEKMMKKIIEGLKKAGIEVGPAVEYIEIPTAPKPEYNKCNKGHTLAPVYSYRLNMYIWDCEACIANNPKIGGK